ncbi:MAG: LamB/YcsF family protein, partial [Acidobacteria bacterium]|nr:LamB/YcsF family protein [Acidobacteriota bacterium]
SANIACGFHAGDPATMRNTVELALQYDVAIGAHPSLPDLQGFGRRSMSVSPGEVYDLVLYQVAALNGFCKSAGGKLHHVKPHGALYNQAAKDRSLARAIAAAVRSIDGDLILYGLSGSELISEAEVIGLRTASEVFADRTYQADGSLTPRTHKDALIEDTALAVQQALRMVKMKSVLTLDGEILPLRAETICIHGDGRNALNFAVAISGALRENGIAIGHC